MYHTFEPIITGEDLARYGTGLDTLVTDSTIDLLQRAELDSSIIDFLLRDARSALDAVAKAGGKE